MAVCGHMPHNACQATCHVGGALGIIAKALGVMCYGFGEPAVGFTAMGKESGATHASDRDEGYDSVATNGLIRLVLYVMINPVGDMKRVVVVKEGKQKDGNVKAMGDRRLSEAESRRRRCGKANADRRATRYCTVLARQKDVDRAARDPHKLRRLWLCLWLGRQTTIGYDLVRYLLRVCTCIFCMVVRRYLLPARAQARQS